MIVMSIIDTEDDRFQFRNSVFFWGKNLVSSSFAQSGNFGGKNRLFQTSSLLGFVFPCIHFVNMSFGVINTIVTQSILNIYYYPLSIAKQRITLPL